MRKKETSKKPTLIPAGTHGKAQGKLTRHALNQLVSIFLVKLKRMQFNNISDKTLLKFIGLMKGTKTSFIMGWCKYWCKKIALPLASESCCCVLMSLCFSAENTEIVSLEQFSSFLLLLEEENLFVQPSIRPPLSPDILHFSLLHTQSIIQEK